VPAAPEPLTDRELTQLAVEWLGSYRVVVLAISGGADSTALLELVRSWRAEAAGQRPEICVATIDHGLRPQAAAEATQVAEAAARFGLPHHTLRWDGAGTSSAIQEAAREARYRLLGQLAAERAGGRPAAVVTGHHAGDQAETMLMRLARGSGLDGVSAMAGVRPLDAHARANVDLVRPFLAIPKARLIATLKAHRQSWSEDPSNQNAAYERVRVRLALAALEEAGITAAAMAHSAARLHRAKDALDTLMLALASEAVELNGGAFAAIRTAPFDSAPTELRLRLLQHLWSGFGAPGPPVRLAQLEDIEKRLSARAAVAATLAGAHIIRQDDRIVLTREPGRPGLPEMALAAGQTATWDGRYRVTAAIDAGSGLWVRPIPAQTLTALAAERRRRGEGLLPYPRNALLTLPSLWRGKTFLGVLHDAFGTRVKLPAAAAFTGTTTRSRSRLGV
jgi:tRNA(Ile)-lysidine synthase